ncbi:class I SAM-dependent methyltransferase [Wolinella succinogenes]|uniref:class I SAM-dependent methyltransferase n=1 Tax=Wolinella succinogenes TaxID=844 RepID=UPI002409134C|nr:class I SAM-dependent methyltransferase [Wolinella succinogenes]
MHPMTLDAIDFNLLYRLQKHSSTYKKKSQEEWDGKAWEINERIHEGFYNDEMERRIDLDGAQSLLDVGCGPGTFALRFAPRLKQVYALDYSPKMLEVLEHNAQKRAISNICPLCLDLEESWEGVEPCDVVIASRCLEVEDMRAVLQKLHEKAKKAVYITYKNGGSFLEVEVLEAMGRKITPKPDYIYLLNILYQMGIRASLDFISPQGEPYGTFDSFESYHRSTLWSIGEMTPQEEAGLREYYEACQKKGKTPAHKNSSWAFISWRK